MSANSAVLGHLFTGFGYSMIGIAAYNHWKPEQPISLIIQPDDISGMCANMAVVRLHETVEKKLAECQTGPAQPTPVICAIFGPPDLKFCHTGRNPGCEVWVIMSGGTLFHCHVVEGPAGGVRIE